MAQIATDLDEWYKVQDPWGYLTNPDDQKRKRRILKALEPRYYKRALDIGAGEGWITKDLPAAKKYGIELSYLAASRAPEEVTMITEPKGYYDLIVATGVLYPQYDFQKLMSWIVSHIAPGGTILTCHIKDWEQPLPFDRTSYVEEFPYREYTQVLRVFEC